MSLLHLHCLGFLPILYCVETLGNLAHVNINPLRSSKESALRPEQPTDVPMS
jgi:hypothetical protein